MKWEPGKFYVLNVRHDDGCGFWRSDNMADCNCNPDVEQVEVDDTNLTQVASDWNRDEAKAEQLREIARRRN